MIGLKITPNVITFTIFIDKLCKDGLVGDAMKVFLQMKSQGILPTVVTYNSLIHGPACMLGQWNDATSLLNEMVGRKIIPDVRTFSVMDDALCKEGIVKDAHGVVEIMVQRGIKPTVFIYNSQLDGYCLQGEIEEVEKCLI
ncbi:hypothetical protein UlMin_006633 [Ulmus minor]